MVENALVADDLHPAEEPAGKLPNKIIGGKTVLHSGATRGALIKEA